MADPKDDPVPALGQDPDVENEDNPDLDSIAAGSENQVDEQIYSEFDITGRHVGDPPTHVRFKVFHWGIAKPDNTWVLIGRRRLGKTQIVKCYMYNMRPWFPSVIVFTKSVADREYEDYVPRSCIIEGLRTPEATSAFKALIALQKEKVANYHAKKKEDPSYEENISMLIIIDDCLSDGLRYCPEIGEVFYEGRHLAVSVLVTMQWCKGIDPGVRDNADVVVLCKTESVTTAEAVQEAWLGACPRHQINKVMTVGVGVDTPHQVMIINAQNPFNEWTDNLYTAIFTMVKRGQFVMGDRALWSEDEQQLASLGFAEWLEYQDWGHFKDTYKLRDKYMEDNSVTPPRPPGALVAHQHPMDSATHPRS